MKKIFLGKSNLSTSIIGLGTINFGTKTSEIESFRLMEEYLLRGGNFIDTSNNYAVWNGGGGGESERTIGKWIQNNGGREKLVIATKVGALPKDLKNRDFSDMEGLSSKVIKESVERSLTNLKSNYIDLLYLHVDDYNTPQEETMETLDELVNKGIVKEIGCSNFRTWRIENARNICNKYGYRFFSAVQQRYSYLEPTIDSDFFPQVPVHEELKEYIDYYKDLTLVAYSPLLNGQYNKNKIEKQEYRTEFNEIKLRKLLSEKNNPNEWVLKYITEQFGGSIALLTTSNIEHLSNIMKSFEV